MAEWRDIGIEPWCNLFQVSDLGEVRYKPRLVTQRKINGYPTVTLTFQGRDYTVKVHRLVASAFIRPPKSGEVINHINAKRDDNRIENLEWCTPAQNNQHTSKLGRYPLGKDHPLGKIDPPVAYEMHRSGASLSSIARYFGCSIQAVTQMIKRAIKAGRYHP